MGKIIDWFKARKAAFKSNKYVKMIFNYVKYRINKKLEIVLRGLGGVFTVWTVAIFAAFVALATGQNPQWGLVAAAGLGATGQYLTQLYRVIFGKPLPNEPVDVEEILGEDEDQIVPD